MALSSSHTFVHQIQNIINWIDGDACHLTKEELIDSIIIRILVLAKKFIAFPHCHNFSLMQQPQQQHTVPTTTTTTTTN